MDSRQLPFLLKLLDDDSERVREEVRRELLTYGDDLEEAVKAHLSDLTAEQRELLTEILEERKREDRRRSWLSWRLLQSDSAKLERAFQFLAEFQYGGPGPDSLSNLLDQLAEEFRESDHPDDALGLSRFLFRDKGLRGATIDYYNPMNSNLVYVIMSGRGIPISLSAIFMLVGERLGYEVHGCNVPGHFLARAQVDGEDHIIDCFSGGRVLSLDEETSLRISFPCNVGAALENPAGPETMIRRVLRNLINAYQHARDEEMEERTREMLEELEREIDA